MLNGRLVRILRKNLGLTQTQLAESIGVELKTIQNWESGAHQPQEKYLFPLGETLGVAPAELKLNFYQLLQEEAIITLYKLKDSLLMVDPEEYTDHLYTYHDAVLKTLKVGGIDPSLAWKNQNAADNIANTQEISSDNNTSDSDIDSYIDEFENGDHDDAVDGDTPKVSKIDPYEE